MSFSTGEHVTPEKDVDDFSKLHTVKNDNLVDAINELADHSIRMIAVEVDYTSTGASAVSVNLPNGAIVIELRAHVKTTFSSGGSIEAGDGSGATAIATSLGTVTSAGDIRLQTYYPAVNGPLLFTAAGAAQSQGAAIVQVMYFVPHS